MSTMAHQSLPLCSLGSFVWLGIHHSEHDGLVHPPQWTKWAGLSSTLCGLGPTTPNMMGLSLLTFMWYGIHHIKNDHWTCLTQQLCGLGSKMVNTMGSHTPPFVWFEIHLSEHNGLVYSYFCVIWDPPQWKWWTHTMKMGLSIPTFCAF